MTTIFQSYFAVSLLYGYAVFAAPNSISLRCLQQQPLNFMFSHSSDLVITRQYELGWMTHYEVFLWTEDKIRELQ
jgi:hypothetical protein